VPEVAFVLSAGQHYPLRELAATLGHELELQAVPSSMHLGGFPASRPNRVYVLLDPLSYTAIEGERALPDEAILKRTIFLCVEPPPAESADEHLDLLGRAGAVFVLDQRSVIAMHRLGIPARLMRPGYSKSVNHFDPDSPRPIDVMFLGAHSRRRTRYLSRAARVLSRYNCLLQVSGDGPSPGDTSSFLAQSRWPLLAQTKVVINLHCGDESRLEWRRALDAIHAGAVVVTEHSSGITPLVAGQHLLVASPDSLPFVAEALLRDEERLAALRSQAYERLSTWIPYALPVSVLRAAVVELVGEPVPAGASLGEPMPKPVAVSSASDSPTAEGALQPTLRSAGDAAARVEVRHESLAWAARRAPRVTVLTALRGDREQILSTLDSLAHSRLRDFELVVVDDGSSEATRALAQSWMVDHPRVAARLVVAGSQGIGGARNIGMDFARGLFCLLLDPGQELYPRCLDVLTGTLEAMPEMAFVYPIQEVTGAPEAFVEAGGDYLMSFLGWDPGRLRRGNHIHAPALIRTGRLRQLGGFATEQWLAGFEDYDLWCRMAEQGWRGQLVNQVLARRTESGSSEVLKALHPSPGPAMTTLMARAPGVMAGALLAS
jgi:Glycosyl transferase family 2